MAQAARISTSHRPDLATVAFAAATALSALAAEFDRLADAGNRVWSVWDGTDPTIGKAVSVFARKMDAVLVQIVRLPGNDLETLRLKARALNHLGFIEENDGGGISHKLVASLIRSLA